MFDLIQKWISVEVLKHPAVFLAGIVCMGFVIGSFNPFVMAGDFERFQTTAGQRLSKLEVSVCNVQNAIEQTSLEAQQRDVSTEIFQLERLVLADKATERDIKRLDELRNEQNALDTRLDVYLRKPACRPDPNGESFVH